MSQLFLVSFYTCFVVYNFPLFNPIEKEDDFEFLPKERNFLCKIFVSTKRPSARQYAHFLIKTEIFKGKLCLKRAKRTLISICSTGDF